MGKRIKLPIATDSFKAKILEVTDAIFREHGVTWYLVKTDRAKYEALKLGVGATTLTKMRAPCSGHLDAKEGSYVKLCRSLKMHYGIDLPLTFNQKGQFDF